MITRFKIFEEKEYDFKVGERVWSKGFERFYKVVQVTDTYIIIEDDKGNQGEFLKKGFIPEIEYNASKYNL